MFTKDSGDSYQKEAVLGRPKKRFALQPVFCTLTATRIRLPTRAVCVLKRSSSSNFWGSASGAAWHVTWKKLTKLSKSVMSFMQFCWISHFVLRIQTSNGRLQSYRDEALEGRIVAHGQDEVAIWGRHHLSWQQLVVDSGWVWRRWILSFFIFSYLEAKWNKVNKVSLISWTDKKNGKNLIKSSPNRPSGLVWHDVGMLISQALWNFIGGQEVAGLVGQHGSADIQHTNVLKPKIQRKENQWKKIDIHDIHDIHDIQIKRLANKDAKLPHAVLLLSRMHAARPLRLQSPSCPTLNNTSSKTLTKCQQYQGFKLNDPETLTIVQQISETRTILHNYIKCTVIFLSKWNKLGHTM